MSSELTETACMEVSSFHLRVDFVQLIQEFATG